MIESMANMENRIESKLKEIDQMMAMPKQSPMQQLPEIPGVEGSPLVKAGMQ